MEQRGELLTAMLVYSREGAIAELDPVTAMAFGFVKATMDREAKKYEERCKKNSDNGKLGGRPKAKKANAFSESERLQKNQSQAKKADSDSDIDLKENLSAKADSQKKVRHKFGEYQHVRLTDVEYDSLVAGFGDDLVKAAVRAVDEYCEKSGKRYKNYNLVIRDWGLNRARELLRSKAPPGNNRFHNFAQRENDYDELQRSLARQSRGRNGERVSAQT